MKPQVQYLLECYTEYTEDKIFEVSENTEHAAEAKENPIFAHSGQNIDVGGKFLQGVDNQEANARIYASLNYIQRQQIRVLARNLRILADSMQIRPPNSLLAVEKGILQNEGLDVEEMQVVNNIHSIKNNTTISKIADYLGQKLTAGTFKAALRFVCYSASSVPDELAIVCELAKVIQPHIRGIEIYDVFSEFIQDKLDAVIH